MQESDEILDRHIYLKDEKTEELIPFYWLNEKCEVDYNNPLTLRNVYEWLKSTLEPKEDKDKQEIKIKSEFKQGHRKRMFNDAEVEKIKELYAKGLSKNKIDKMYGCSEKTIRNYLKT